VIRPLDGHVPLDHVLRGAIDLHVHGVPEIRSDWDTSADNIRTGQLARERGMTGYVLKSHVWPTMDRAAEVERHVPGIRVFSSITLNRIAGGVSAAAVLLAAAQGARFAWLPTWQAEHDLGHGGFSRIVRAQVTGDTDDQHQAGLRVVDGDGSVTEDCARVLATAKDCGLGLGTGHVSPAESVAVAEAAAGIGFDRLVFTHPCSPGTSATVDHLRRAADLGCYIELPAVLMTPAHPHATPQGIIDLVDTFGPERIVLTTDAGWPRWAPPAADFLRLYVGTLIDAGLGVDAVRTMIVDNPRLVLGLPPYTDGDGDGA